MRALLISMIAGISAGFHHRNFSMIFASSPISILATRYRFNSKYFPVRGCCLTLLLLAAGSFSSIAAPPAKASWSGVVTYVVDGDTVRVRPPGGGKPVAIRLEGIDAPEICQAFGTASRDALMRQVLGKRVQVYGKRHDDYGRLLARLEFQGQDTGRWMVTRGLAWSYRVGSSAGPYAAQQRRARAAGLGLFSPALGTPPEYPAQFRRQHGS
ncbi:MAG: thermonuclease family protein, partial [Bacteroidia bacterium]|nr:thermonuclease family protein [Bacteroidia bacterium]